MKSSFPKPWRFQSPGLLQFSAPSRNVPFSLSRFVQVLRFYHQKRFSASAGSPSPYQNQLNLRKDQATLSIIGDPREKERHREREREGVVVVAVPCSYFGKILKALCPPSPPPTILAHGSYFRKSEIKDGWRSGYKRSRAIVISLSESF